MKYLKSINENNKLPRKFDPSGRFRKTLITVGLADDWEGIYHNGILIEEGHSINWSNVIVELIEKGINLSGYTMYHFVHYKDGEYEDFPFIEEWNLPKNIEDYIDKIKEHGYSFKLSK